MSILQKRSWLLVALIVIVFGLLIKHYWQNRAGMGGEMPPTIVEAVTANARTWQDTFHATGSLQANQGIVVAPEVPGRVTQIFFHSGDVVKAGAPIVQLDQGVLLAQLADAQAKLLLSQSDFDRVQHLYQTKVSSRADLDKATSSLHSNQANVALAKAYLAQTLLVAPFSGRLGIKKIDVGDYVNAGQAIATLEDTENIRVNFSIPETYLKSMLLGQNIVVKSYAIPDLVFNGQIIAFDSVMDEGTRSLPAQATIANTGNKLIPGSFAEVTVPLGPARSAISIPSIALVYTADVPFVYKIENGHAKRVPVQVGMRNEDQVEILQGINVGDVIITTGQLKINDGAPVITTTEVMKSQQKK